MHRTFVNVGLMCLQILGFFVVISLLWGVLIEPRIVDEEHFTVRIPNLGESWNGKRIAVMADLQIGMWLDNENTIKEMVKRIVRARPATVLIAGDFIYHPFEEQEGDFEDLVEEIKEEEDERKAKWKELMDEAIHILKPLGDANLPVFAVLGNHDYGMDEPHSPSSPWLAQELTVRLEKIRIKVLNNESSAIWSKEKEPLIIVGIGPHYPKRDRPRDVLQEVVSFVPRIVFMHNPSSFASIPPGKAPIAIAAHTHGGQIRIPFFPKWSWMDIVMEREVHEDGWIRNYGQKGNQLYVQRGIGFSDFPIRINCPPELTYFTLQ